MINFIRASIKYHSNVTGNTIQYGDWHKIVAETSRYYLTACGVVFVKDDKNRKNTKLELKNLSDIGIDKFCEICKLEAQNEQ